MTISEVRGFPAPGREVAAWAVAGDPAKVVHVLVEIARRCTEEVGASSENSLEVDIFWGPVQPADESVGTIPTVFCFPRAKAEGRHRKLGATEFMGLFVFNSDQYFSYTSEQAIEDLIDAGLPWKEVSDAAGDLAAGLVDEGALPRTAAEDALHIAVAAVHAAVRSEIERVWRVRGYEPPVICTPEELNNGDEV